MTPSEQGLRIIGAQGDGSRLYRKQKIDDGGWWKLHGLDKAPSLESYRNCEKYITITGNVFRDLPPANLDQVMDEVVAELDKKPNGGAYHARLEEDDSDEIDDLIKNGCGDHYGGDRSRAVWRVITELVRRGTSATVIESVLLARDNRISDHIYDQSNPVEYVRRQIAKAIDERRGEQIARNIEIGEDVTEPILPTILTLPEMIDRLVFIGSSSSVADRLTGRIRKKEAAKEEYAASKYKKAQALKLWIGSPQRLTVDVINWIPGAKTICRPLETSEGAQTAYNSWRGIRPIAAPDDWQERLRPFLDHVAYLVPEPNRKRFLQWLAHIVQRPEVLPHTAYLMIAENTGIGRNLLASILVRALRGHVAAGMSLPELLEGGFTGRLSQKLLSIIDEAKEGNSEGRYKRAERLKSLITEEHRKINPKYGVETIEKNCCRWLMFSNYLDAVPFDDKDRRIEVIPNPTEPKSADYYKEMYGMLDDSAFIGSVRKYLETLDITDFNPGQHAEMSETKRKALDEMSSEIDRYVSEFKEDCTFDLTSRSFIYTHVQAHIEGKEVKDAHLTHAIRRAGMMNTTRRVWIDGVRHRVVIVRGAYTPEMVKNATEEKLIEVINPLTDADAAR